MTASIPEAFPASGTDLAVQITLDAGVMHRIGLHMRFDGRLDPERSRKAVRLLLDSEPILGTVFEPNARRWHRLSDLDERVPFSAVETDDPENAGVAFQAEEIPAGGPQIAVRLFRGADHDELGMKISHVLADGQAAKQCAYLLSDIYTKLGADAALRAEPDLRQRPTELDVWNGLTPEQQRRAKTASNWTMPNWPAPFIARTGRGLTYRSLTLSQERFSTLKTYGKERDATVNDMLVAAYFRSLVEKLDPPTGKPLALMATADHRRYLKNAGDPPVANLSISGSLDIERVDGETFDSTLARVREHMAKWASTCYGAAPAKGAEKMARMPFWLMRALVGTALKMPGGSGKTLAYLTNIGIIDEARLRFDGVAPVSAWMFGPCAGAGASIVAAVSTYRDALTFTMGFCSEDMDEEIIDDVLGGTERELTSLS